MEITARIERFIIEEISMGAISEVAPTRQLIEDRVLDSLSLLRLIAFIEEEYDVAVLDGELVPENFQTVESIRAYIERKLKPKGE